MGKFQKGHKKLGGRAKGTPNKRQNIFDSLNEIVTEDGKPVDVVKLFFEGLMTMPQFQRVDALLEFMQFIFPKKKHIATEDITDDELKELLKERLENDG